MALAKMLRERGKDSGEAALQSEEIQQRAIKMQTEAAIAIAKASAARAAFQATSTRVRPKSRRRSTLPSKQPTSKRKKPASLCAAFPLPQAATQRALIPRLRRDGNMGNNPTLRRLAEYWAGHANGAGRMANCPAPEPNSWVRDAARCNPEQWPFEWAALLSAMRPCTPTGSDAC